MINFLRGADALPLRKMNVYSEICSKSETTAKIKRGLAPGRRYFIKL